MNTTIPTITNTKTSLHPDDSPRNAAKNIIKYTLLLDYKSPEFDAKNTIATVMEQVHHCCDRLFSLSTSGSPSNISFNHDFFGSNADTSKNTLTRIQYPNSQSDMPSLIDMILQNSVLTAYHAILTEYFDYCDPVSAYQINNLKGKGPYWYMNQKIITAEENRVQFNKSKTKDLMHSGEYCSSKSSDFNRSFSLKRERLSSLSDYLVKKDKPLRFRPQFTTLCHSFKKITPNYILNFYEENSNVSLFDYSKRMIELFTPERPSLYSLDIKQEEFRWSSHADMVYHYYIAEKAYNCNFIYALISNIVNIEKNSNFRFYPDTIPILVNSISLTNPFSRTFFLRFAFDHINPGTNSYHDYWHHHELDRRNTIAPRTYHQPRGFHFDYWLHQFEQFTNYFSKFIIPIYDWCFINMLLETVEKVHTEETHLRHLEIALKILADYITEKHCEIVQPIDMHNRKDELGIMNKKPNWVHLENRFPEQNMKQLKDAIIANSSIELNITPLDLNLFKQKEGGGSNIPALHSFYLESIIGL